MKTKRIQQALRVVKEAFEAAGQAINEATLEFAIEMAQDSRFQELVNQPEKIATASVVAGCIQVAKQYETLPAHQWEEFLGNLRRELPYSLRRGFTTGIKTIVKSFPKRPSTGRHLKLTLEKKKKACDLVSKHHRNGDSLRAAYEKVARQFDCSSRTVQRAWKDRGRFVSKNSSIEL